MHPLDAKTDRKDRRPPAVVTSVARRAGTPRHGRSDAASARDAASGVSAWVYAPLNNRRRPGGVPRTAPDPITGCPSPAASTTPEAVERPCAAVARCEYRPARSAPAAPYSPGRPPATGLAHRAGPPRRTPGRRSHPGTAARFAWPASRRRASRSRGEPVGDVGCHERRRRSSPTRRTGAATPLCCPSPPLHKCRRVPNAPAQTPYLLRPTAAAEDQRPSLIFLTVFPIGRGGRLTLLSPHLPAGSNTDANRT